MSLLSSTDELAVRHSAALIGRGGMGAAYYAREPFLERSVAVKVLTTESASAEAPERFLREARIAERRMPPHMRVMQAALSA
jgi:serine/threonine protein kinase